MPPSIPQNRLILNDTPHPEIIPPPTNSDTDSHDSHGEQARPTSYSSASPVTESAPATPADSDSHHTQTAEPRLNSGGPTFLDNPTFDDTKELESFFLPSEQSTRLSVTTIDGAEGIGLSLLQNFMGDGRDDDSDASSDTDIAGYPRQGSPDSTVDDRGLNYDLTPPQSVDGHQSTPRPTSASTSLVNQGSRVSRASSHPSEYSDQGEEWEGASDIYDNYRYSRFSVASKLSTFSKGSMKAPPPIPLSAQHQSLERDFTGKRPTALDLELRSPLLHTTFGSPVNSPSEPTTTSAPSNTTGVATAIRHRFESGTSPEVPTTKALHSIPAREGDIVISDDEEGSQVVPTNGSSRPTSPTDAGNQTIDSTTSSQGTGDDSSAIKTDLAFDPFLEMQPLRFQRTPSSPPPKETHPAPPPQPLAIAQPRPSKPPAFDFGSSRTSMFLPHPGAPKAPGTVPVGPLYGRVKSPPSSVPGVKHSRTSLVRLLQVVATTQMFPNGALRRMTVYGKCEVDLASAIGPVPITFSLEPLNSVPANRILPFRSQSSDSNSTPPPSQPTTPTNQSFLLQSTPAGANPRVIPRPNFSPKKPQIRPRSRSFSGFDSTSSQAGLNLVVSE